MISRVRTMMRSPRTPRRSASSPRAPRPRQSTTMSATSDAAVHVTPDTISTPARCASSSRKRIAWRGATWPSPAIKQALREAVGEIGLDGADGCRIQALEALRQPREAIDLAMVARRRHHQRALHDGARIDPTPDVDGPEPEVADHRRGRLRLAVGGEHGAGAGAGGLRERSRERSTSRTRCPRCASVSACHRPTMPAPATVMVRVLRALHARQIVSLRAPRPRGADRRRPRAAPALRMTMTWVPEVSKSALTRCP